MWKQHYMHSATCKGNQPGAWRPNVPVRLKSLIEEPRTSRRADALQQPDERHAMSLSLRPHPRNRRVRCCADGELLPRICCRAVGRGCGRATCCRCESIDGALEHALAKGIVMVLVRTAPSSRGNHWHSCAITTRVVVGGYTPGTRLRGRHRPEAVHCRAPFAIRAGHSAENDADD